MFMLNIVELLIATTWTKSSAVRTVHPPRLRGSYADGLGGEDVVVEVRCPATGRNEMIEPGPVFPFLEYQTSETSLKRSNSYFDQVQGQMFVTNKSMWDLVVSNTCEHEDSQGRH